MSAGIRRHRRHAAQASGNGRRRLQGRRQDPRPRAARQVLPLHAARRRSRAGAGRRSRRNRRALHPPQLDRADRHHLAVAGQQRIERHRAVVRAPLQPQRDPRRQEVQGKGRGVQLRAAGLPRADQRQGDAVRRTTPRTSCPTTSSPPTTSARRSTSTSRPPRRNGSIRRSPRPRTSPPTTRTRTSRTSTATPTSRA